MYFGKSNVRVYNLINCLITVASSAIYYMNNREDDVIIKQYLLLLLFHIWSIHFIIVNWKYLDINFRPVDTENNRGKEENISTETNFLMQVYVDSNDFVGLFRYMNHNRQIVCILFKIFEYCTILKSSHTCMLLLTETFFVYII